MNAEAIRMTPWWRDKGLDYGLTMEQVERSDRREMEKKELTMFGNCQTAGWQNTFKRELYFIGGYLIIYISAALSIKYKNIQVGTSSGREEYWNHAGEQNEGHSHLNQGGGWFSTWGFSSWRRLWGERNVVPGATSSEPRGGKKKEPEKDTRSSPSRWETGTVKGVKEMRHRFLAGELSLQCQRLQKGQEELFPHYTRRSYASSILPRITYSFPCSPVHLFRINFRKADKIEASTLWGPSELGKMLTSIKSL